MRNVGIEIEVESRTVSARTVETALNNSPWMLDLGEGSLRAGEFGWEIKTASNRGLPLEEALASLNLLYPVLTGSSGCWRAAVHVHVNVRDLSGPQRALALCVGYVMDPALFSLTSPERVESNFCVPLAHKFSDVMSSVRGLAHSGLVEGYGKYSSINIACLARFGTFEFRHMKTPATDGRVESVQNCLTSIARFATAAAHIVDAARWRSVDSAAQVLPAFIDLMQTKYLLPRDIPLVPDPLAVSDVIGALSYEQGIDPMAYPLPAIARALGRGLPRRRQASENLYDLVIENHEDFELEPVELTEEEVRAAEERIRRSRERMQSIFDAYNFSTSGTQEVH